MFENIISYRYTRDACKEVAKASSPIKLLGFSFFCVYRTYDDGSYFCLLNSRTDFYKNFVSNIKDGGDYFTKEYNNTPAELYSYHKFAWPKPSNEESKKDANFSLLREKGIGNGGTIFQRGNGYIDTYSFAGELEDENLEEVFKEECDNLKEFIKSFQYHCSDLLINGKKNLAHYGNKIDMRYIPNEKEAKIKEFLKIIKAGRYVRKKDGTFVCLSPRLAECAKLYMQRMSAKEIAIELNISPKTVEWNLAQVRYFTDSYKFDI